MMVEKEKNKLFADEIKKHKEAIYAIGQGKLSAVVAGKTLTGIRIQSTLLALFWADYKCESCGADKRLTQQHLIKNREQLFISDPKFYAARNYFFNTAILCIDCHAKADYLPEKTKEAMIEIKSHTIQLSKEMFGLTDKVKTCATCGQVLPKKEKKA